MKKTIEQLRDERDSLVDKIRSAFVDEDFAYMEILQKEYEKIDRKIRSKK